MEKRHPNHPGELSTDEAAAVRNRPHGELQARAGAVQRLTEAGVPFVVAGAYAYGMYTGIYRDTKDLDLFLRPADALRALEILRRNGWRTERTHEHWLYKGFKGEWFVDLIFSSGNGVCAVDDQWFAYATPGMLLDQAVLFAPPEEMIWSKAFVMERERFDGADVLHLLRSVGDRMDWGRLLRRFDRHWEVLLAHILLFWFAYPSQRSIIPNSVISALLDRARQSAQEGDWSQRICRGDLLSAVNYQVDIREWGYLSGRKWDEAERQGGERNGARSERESQSGGVG